LDKPASEYTEGETVTGLRITQSDPAQSRLAVSFKKSAADFTPGAQVTGTITKIMNFGVFLDIGASIEALAPASLLAKEPSEYTQGEELTDLSISQVDVKNNKISVAQAGATGKSSGKLTINDLKVGQEIEGTVKGSKEYGVFMDIGLYRKDALLPTSLFGDAKMEDFIKDRKMTVYVSAVDRKQDRVTLSVDDPSTMAAAMNFNPMDNGGDIPFGFMLPDAKRWEAMNGPFTLSPVMSGNRLGPIEAGEPVNMFDWEKRHPGFIEIEKEQPLEMYYFAEGKGGFSGVDMMQQSAVCYIPIPLHLRKPDAGPAEIPAHSFDDYPLSYDYGIKPEIHVKYRQPPFNDPNWTYRPPSAEDFAKAERSRLQRSNTNVAAQVAEAEKDEPSEEPSDEPSDE